VQAQANVDRQKAESDRTVALAKQGIMSKQASEEAAANLAVYQAAVETAKENVVAAEASLREAQAHEIQAEAAARTVASTRDQVQNAKALSDQAAVELGYSKVYAPVTGKVDVWAARQGEVVGAGTPIVTIMDLTQTWVYAPLPETQADAVKLGDSLRVVMPSGASVQGKVIAKSAEADFATQRDINGGRKRDIKTIRLKLVIDNPGEKFVPGMTADVYIPRDKLVKQ
jgi:HlyD family secretion protein